MTPVARLISQLEGVRETGPGRWIAICPGHADRSPSLSIRELDDGRLLLHDFGGCETQRVLAAINLDMSALFPRGPITHRLRAGKRGLPASDLLRIVSHEVTVVDLIVCDWLTDSALTSEAESRLRLASGRIHTIADELRR